MACHTLVISYHDNGVRVVMVEVLAAMPGGSYLPQEVFTLAKQSEIKKCVNFVTKRSFFY